MQLLFEWDLSGPCQTLAFQQPSMQRKSLHSPNEHIVYEPKRGRITLLDRWKKHPFVSRRPRNLLWYQIPMESPSALGSLDIDTSDRP